MQRLRCGTIISKSFVDYIAGRFADDAAKTSDEILSISYLRCAEGDDEGRMWWQENWLPKEAAPDHEIFRVGEHCIRLGKRSQQGLKDRYIDMIDGSVKVS